MAAMIRQMKLLKCHQIIYVLSTNNKSSSHYLNDTIRFKLQYMASVGGG
jgi:hypothetical protein